MSTFACCASVAPHRRMRMAEAADGDSAAKIEIFAALFVPHPPALALDQGQTPLGRGERHSDRKVLPSRCARRRPISREER